MNINQEDDITISFYKTFQKYLNNHNMFMIYIEEDRNNFYFRINQLINKKTSNIINFSKIEILETGFNMFDMIKYFNILIKEAVF